ncbi:MAG: hypothetical protein JJ900_03645 [Rhodospirillales bacterium]|nr:hypothetical protein [Rhodospirillales bacterium]MBO6785919.1 hypothetical protein [Rhodospirillales bacterium]
MRIAILTTQTPHHAHFVRALAKRYEIASVLLETAAVQPPFDTAHDFETERQIYEVEHWFGQAAEPDIGDFAPCARYASLNDPDALKHLDKASPDIAIVFGTGRLAPSVLDLLPGCILNLHGGNPEHYRGLDTHLWAIYHDDYEGLVSCLHLAEPELDTGAVLAMRPVPLRRGMELYELRAANTETCIDISVEQLDRLGSGGQLQFQPLQTKGRYYSFMPACLKSLCVDKFRRYTEKL